MIYLMEFQDVVRKRRMVRRYSPQPVPAGVVDRMLQNALHAPSAGFSQGWAFLVLDRPADLDRFWAVTMEDQGEDPGTEDSRSEPDSWLEGMRTAPVVIVPLSNKAGYLRRYAEADKGWTDQDEARWPVPYWHIDTGMATLLMLQTAVDEGLGACFFGIPPSRIDAFRREFGVPEEYTPIGAMSVGHRTGDTGAKGSTSRGRRPVEEVVHRGSWEGPRR
jgi:nitroreductase